MSTKKAVPKGGVSDDRRVLTGPIEVPVDQVEGERGPVSSNGKTESVPRGENGKWKKGQSGNPKGRPKKSPFGKTLSAVLAGRLAAYKEDNLEMTMKERVVDACLAQALLGDMRAIEFIFERMEGKVPVKVDLTERIREIALAEGLDPDKAVTEARRLVGADQR